jgi:hypothetical protein
MFFMPVPGPRSRVKKIQDPRSGSASKNLSIFNPKNCSKAFGRILVCSSRIRIFFHTGCRIRIPDPDPGFGVPHGELFSEVSSGVVYPDSLNPDTDPDPAFQVNPDSDTRIQGFDDQKLKGKNTAIY